MEDTPNVERRSSCAGACTIEAVVSVDARGQVVLPKEIRDRAGIAPGDRLAVVFWEKEGDVCCITLIKASHFNGMVTTLLSPMAEDLAGRGEQD
ncbi:MULTISPECIES: HgcAB-associated protein HgcC [unclassified Methanoculleus]|uniref:HgcAB-associated protein HgcC n=1 Tax=unclassified Methanoculleus TaxID=2619537 RepID=UPI0025DB050C|nr:MULTISPECIES: HgcAB-associated protein [unclassified Methanoculleus]MCK9318542.1 AbrB/MazE/SpoVT family DNA-binding domain-containing protein [Methanoculleus sp.]MDD2254383.1 HgcAB-associated protein [Methanoculleus sp.]MDD2788595.1 HgcAB-associated protein [Methanoculleus sp.]MDD3215169.1 HgcAB-associated protein [Methanoculleus sp.]MDD4314891.1 HgcAB-associated protein [Methanoculleus sp.]